MLSFVYIAHESQQNKCYHIATWVRPMNPISHPVACCGMLLGVVAKSLKMVKLLSQQLPTFLFFHDCRGVAQQCWIRLHSFSNIAGAIHEYYTWSPWSLQSLMVVPFPQCTAGPTLLGVVASVWTPLPTQMQQFPTLLGCWELLRSIRHTRSLLKKI